MKGLVNKTGRERYMEGAKKEKERGNDRQEDKELKKRQMNCPLKRANRSSRTAELVNFTEQFKPITFKTCSDQNFVDG